MKIEKNVTLQTGLTGTKNLKVNDETTKDRVILGGNRNDNLLTMGDQLKDMKASSFASKFELDEISALPTTLSSLLGIAGGEILAISLFGSTGGNFLLGGLGGAVVGGVIGLVGSNMLEERSIKNSSYDDYM